MASRRTSAQIAQVASKMLTSKPAGKASKFVAASALSQRAPKGKR